jgi:hypothetical protein
MYLKQGKEVFDLSDYSILENIDNKVYSFGFHQFKGCFLQEENDLTVPDPLFDVDKGFREIVLKSFENNQFSTGVILSGDKGTGKTVCAKLLCIESGLPVILIKDSVLQSISSDFFNFINKLPKCVIFIDEFEKNFKLSDYDEDNKKITQEMFLTTLDGFNNNSKKLFIFTVNENVSTYLINRPSRIRWFKDYSGVSNELFDIIAEKTLNNKEFKEDLENNIDLNDCNIDIIVSIIKEINIQDKKYSEFKDFFNYRTENNLWKISKLVDGQELFISFTKNVWKRNGNNLRGDFINENGQREYFETNLLQSKDNKKVVKIDDILYVLEKQEISKTIAYI